MLTTRRCASYHTCNHKTSSPFSDDLKLNPEREPPQEPGYRCWPTLHCQFVTIKLWNSCVSLANLVHVLLLYSLCLPLLLTFSFHCRTAEPTFHLAKAWRKTVLPTVLWPCFTQQCSRVAQETRALVLGPQQHARWPFTSLNLFLSSPSWPEAGFPSGLAGKESACNSGDLGSIPGLGRSPGEGKGYPTPVFWPGGFCKELGTTERQWADLPPISDHRTLELQSQGRAENPSRTPPKAGSFPS